MGNQFRRGQTGTPGNKGKYDTLQRGAVEGDLAAFAGHAARVAASADPDGADLLDQAYYAAYGADRRTGYADLTNGVADTDDLAQETAEALLRARARNNGEIVEAKHGAYAARVALNIAGTARASSVRAEDRRAATQVRRIAEEMEQQSGRRLAYSEYDALIDEVHERWPDPKHPFNKDVVHSLCSRERITIPTAWAEAIADNLVSDPWQTASGAPHKTEGRYLTLALDGVEGQDGATRRQASRVLYNAIAESREAPLVDAGALSQRQVTRARTTVTEAGGIAAVIEQWRNGSEGPAVEALFAPWPGSDVQTRAAVVEVLDLRGPEGHDAFWASALQLANTRNA